LCNALQEELWGERVCSYLELMRVFAALFGDIKGCGLTRKQDDLTVRQELLTAMAALIPVIPVMRMSLMISSGRNALPASSVANGAGHSALA